MNAKFLWAKKVVEEMATRGLIKRGNVLNMNEIEIRRK